MSKYPVQYESASKGAMNIEDMPDGHLHNAARKLENVAAQRSLYEYEATVLEALRQEIAARAAASEQSPPLDPEGT